LKARAVLKKQRVVFAKARRRPGAAGGPGRE